MIRQQKQEWIYNIENCKKELLVILKRNNCELIIDDFSNIIIRDIKTMKDESDLIDCEIQSLNDFNTNIGV